MRDFKSHRGVVKNFEAVCMQFVSIQPCYIYIVPRPPRIEFGSYANLLHGHLLKKGLLHFAPYISGAKTNTRKHHSN